MKTRVVLIEDDSDIRDLITFHFTREGFDIQAFPDGAHFVSRLTSHEINPHLILLDIMLPGKSGLEICKELKAQAAIQHIPVVMISARGSESDVVTGLELGADDYVVKPFSIREVLARVRAVLRRKGGATTDTKSVIEAMGIQIDPIQYQVKIRDQIIKFTLTEFSLLKCLMSRPGQVLTRNQLIDMVLGSSVSVVDRTIDVHVVSIRKKLGELGNNIETVRGVGYRFSIPSLESSKVSEALPQGIF